MICIQELRGAFRGLVGAMSRRESDKGTRRERFLRLMSSAIYLIVPILWLPGVSFDSLKAAAFLVLFLPSFAVWIVGVSDQCRPVAPPKVTLPLAVMFGVSALSLMVAPSWRLALPALFWQFTMSLFLLFLLGMMQMPGIRDLLSRVVCVSAALAAAFGIFQFYDLFNVAGSYGTSAPLFSTFGNHNLAASFMAGILPLAIAFLLTDEGPWAWAWTTVIIPCYVFILLTQSRSPLSALVVGIISAAVIGRRIPALNLPRGGVRRIFWISVLLATATVIYTTPNLLNLRASPFGRIQGTFVPGTNAYYSRSVRQTVREATLLMVRDHPILGIGVGNFPTVSSEYIGRAQAGPSNGPRGEIWWQAHNEYLQTLAELGPLGLLAFLSLVLAPVFHAVRRPPTSPLSVELPRLAVLAGLVAILVDSLLSFPLRKPPNVLLFVFLLGAAYSLNASARADDGPSDYGHPRWNVIPAAAASAISRLQEPIAVLCVIILAVGTAFGGGHLAGEIIEVKAEAFAQAGEIQAAVGAYRRARHLAPFKWDIPVRLGVLYASSGHPREAIETLADADRFFKEGTTARALGVAYGAMGNLEAARREFRRALLYDPGDAQARFGLTMSYLDHGDYDQAAAEARLGLKLNPENGHLRYVLGTSLARLGQMDEAFNQLVDAQRLLENDPEITEALEGIARAVGRIDVAERARRRLAADEAAQRAIGVRGRSESAAVEWLNIALQRDPEYGFPHFELGRIYFESRRQSLALQEFREYLRKAPSGEAAKQASTYVRVLEHPSILARVLGRDLRFDVGI